MYIEHGVSVFSAPSTDGRSLFQKAFLERNEDMVKCIKDIAEEHHCQLSLQWTSSQDENEYDLLSSALETKRDDHVHEAVELVCSDVAPFRNGATINKNLFTELAASKFEILEHALKNNVFVTHACDLDVHVKFMRSKNRRKTAAHVETSDTFLDWKQTRDSAALAENWRTKNKDMVDYMERNGNLSTTQASLQFVRIEDAAKTGMDGIIRPLLLRNVPARFFQYDVVHWVVKFKWTKIWRGRFLRGALHYGLFLLLFTAYGISLSRISVLSKSDLSRKLRASFWLAVTIVLGVKMGIKEKRQMQNYMKDAEQHVMLPPGESRVEGNEDIGKKQTSKWVGLQYYFRFPWNWLDVTLCLLLMAVIVPLHIFSLFFEQTEEWLSGFVAIESLAVFVKVGHSFLKDTLN